jgi:GAF domain-containing protein
MSTHIKVATGALEKPSKNREKDAEVLVDDCIEKITDAHRCPPKLLVLWLTPSFRPYDSFLTSVHDRLHKKGYANVPLIGCSVAACANDTGVHENGAALLCFASRFMEAHISCAREAQSLPDHAAEELAVGLGLSLDIAPAELRNRLLILFLPGYGATMKLQDYQAGEIVEALRHYCPADMAMFGGVASAGINRDVIGVQFFGTEVLERAAVGASITLNTTFKVGISHGLKPTEDQVTIGRLGVPEEMVRTIDLSAVRCTTKKMNPIMVLGLETPALGEKIISANVAHGNLILSQPVPPGSKLKILRPDLPRMARSVQQLINAMSRDLRVPDQNLAATVMIGCVARYHYRKSQGVAVGGAFRKLFKAASNAVHVGCYLDGELAGDSRSPFKLCNWSCPQLLLADEIAVTYELKTGVDSLARFSNAMFTAPSLSETMKCCLECIRTAGYHGAMISLIAKQGKIDGIIGRQAIGKGWESIVLKRTIRTLKGNDVLAIVARERRWKFIENAQKSKICNRQTARLGRVFSFYAAPLINEHGEVFGILQIDLGDRRGIKSLPIEQEKILHLLSQATASALNRSILADELRLMQQFDMLLPKCATRDSIEEAVSDFVREGARILDADVHVRLRDERHHKILKLISGTGAYYEACLRHRPRIWISSKSPGADAVRRRKPNIVNDADDDPTIKALLRRSKRGEIARALRAVKAYANFPIMRIGNRAVGFVCIVASEKYCLSPSRIRTLQHIVGRLSLLLSHIGQKVATESSMAEVKFLQAISPSLRGGAPIYELLNEHLHRIAVAAGAEAAACFLQDEIQDRLVLRAQFGWHSERLRKKWLDAAAYSKAEGFTGFVAHSRRALYVSDLSHFARQNRLSIGKWFPEMFDGISSDLTNCEAIGLPLRFEKQGEGALILYRRRKSDPMAASGFATTDCSTLDKAAKIYSAFITALLRVDLSGWRTAQNRHLQVITRQLLKLQLLPMDEVLPRFCELIISEYGFRHCAVYLKCGINSLQLCAHSARTDVAVQQNFEPDQRVTSKFRDVLEKEKTLTIRSENVIKERTPLAYSSANIPEGIIIPIKVDLKVVGLLVFLWRRRRGVRDTGYLPHHDEGRLELVADQLGIAIKSARRRNQVQWQRFQLEHSQNRTIRQSRSEAFDRLATSIADSLQSVASKIDGLSKVLHQNFSTDFHQQSGSPIAQALSDLRAAYETMIRKASEAKAPTSGVKGKTQRVSVREAMLNILRKLRSGLDYRDINAKLIAPENCFVQTLRNDLNSLLEDLILDAISESRKHTTISLEARPGPENSVDILITDAAIQLSSITCNAINSLTPIDSSIRRAWRLSLAHRQAHAIGGLLTVRPAETGNTIILTLPAKLYGH